MYDLVIIGGGPCGSAAGRAAGKAGLETLLLEKEVFPRYKACGGALSEQAMSYLDFTIPDHIHERNIFGARVHFEDQVIERHRKGRIATLVTRSILDTFLLDRARDTGIEVGFGQPVLDFAEGPGLVEIRTNQGTYRTKFAIVAEGAQGRLRHKIRPRDRTHEYGICAVTEVGADSLAIDKYIHDAIDLHFGHAYGSYGWVLPHQNYFSVGIAGLAKDLSGPRAVLAEFLSQRGLSADKPVHVHVVPAGGVKRRLLGARVLLAGDAAGFVDPFYGEGIAYAIRSGQIAAEIVARIVKEGAALDTLRTYQHRCESEFGDNLRYSLMISRIMHSYPGIFFKIFTRHAAVVDKFLEVAAAELTYKGYIKWLLPRVPKFLLAQLRL